ncbi:hypothetical protein Tco_0290146 [Tanacetum coccineum]
MGDKNHIRTLGAYFRPSYEGYRNTIELPDGNNVVPLRSDTIRLIKMQLLESSSCRIPSYTWEDLLLVSGSFFPRKGYAKLQYDYYVPTHQGDLFLKHGLAYVKAVSSDPHLRNLNGPPRQDSFTFSKRVRPDPQSQALEISFEARVRDYMAAHTERIERFKMLSLNNEKKSTIGWQRCSDFLNDNSHE